MRSLESFALTLLVAAAFVATATANPAWWDSWPFNGHFNISNWLPKPDSNGRYPISIASGNNIQLSTGFWTTGQKLLYSEEKDVQLQADQTEDTLEFSYPQDGANNVKIGRVTLELYSDETMQARLYVVDGGIGQDHIKLELKVKNSQDFHYSIRIYGTEN